MDKNGADRYYGANAGTAEVVESKLKEMDAEYLVLESDISNEDAAKELYGETDIEITHHCLNWKGCAKGAVNACIWMAGKPAGLYGIRESMGL